jgi:hypothetical protein
MTQLPTMAHRTGGIGLMAGLTDCPSTVSLGDILCFLVGGGLDAVRSSGR